MLTSSMLPTALLRFSQAVSEPLGSGRRAVRGEEEPQAALNCQEEHCSKQ